MVKTVVVHMMISRAEMLDAVRSEERGVVRASKEREKW